MSDEQERLARPNASDGAGKRKAMNMEDTHAARAQNLVNVLKAQREELDLLVAEYEKWSRAEEVERSVDLEHQNQYAIMSQQAQRSEARARLMNLTEAMAKSARALY